jgi:hypothetical protein
MCEAVFSMYFFFLKHLLSRFRLVKEQLIDFIEFDQGLNLSDSLVVVLCMVVFLNFIMCPINILLWVLQCPQSYSYLNSQNISRASVLSVLFGVGN